MDTMVVTVARAPQSLDQVAASVRLLDGESLRESPAITLDGALRSVARFSASFGAATAHRQSDRAGYRFADSVRAARAVRSSCSMACR
jgi:outer membrane cobalamin receptor